MLNEARVERDKLLKEANEIKDQILAKAKSDAKSEGDKMISAAKEAIEMEKVNAMNQLKTQVANLSVDLAEKILRNKMQDRSQQEVFVNDSLKNITLNYFSVVFSLLFDYNNGTANKAGNKRNGEQNDE